MTPEILLYALLSGPCEGKDCAKLAALHLPPQNGLLLYSDLADCKADAKRMEAFGVMGPDGVTKWDVRLPNYCAHIYFADYAQTERLIFGKVMCFYQTTFPEGVMARLLDPYRTHPECAAKAPK